MDSTMKGWPRVCIPWQDGVSCSVSAAWQSCVAAHWPKYHCYDLRCLKAMLNPNKQTTEISAKMLLIKLLDDNSVKALSDDKNFAHDSLQFNRTRFLLCCVGVTILFCETNLRQSQGIITNRLKKLHCVRIHAINVSLLANIVWAKVLYIYQLYHGFLWDTGGYSSNFTRISPVFLKNTWFNCIILQLFDFQSS